MIKNCLLSTEEDVGGKKVLVLVWKTKKSSVISFTEKNHNPLVLQCDLNQILLQILASAFDSGEPPQPKSP